MLVLASARELILLFVAFELMSIPLYVLTGFLKREDAAPEAALKFFLVGTASSAVIVYGMSFVYGVTGTTELAAIPAGAGDGPSADAARHGAAARRPRLQDRGRSRSTCGRPMRTRPPARRLSRGSSVAPKAAGFVAIIRLYVEGVGRRVARLDARRSPRSPA